MAVLKSVIRLSHLSDSLISWNGQISVSRIDVDYFFTSCAEKNDLSYCTTPYNALKDFSINRFNEK